MRRLRARGGRLLVRPGGRRLPSAATTSGCHALAGRGRDDGGEIRRIKRAQAPAVPTRKHGLRS